MTTFPQISRNGTSTDELVLQQHDVLTAARALRAALIKAHPHMRDYQYRPSEGADAIGESNDRIAAVDSIIDQTMDIARYLCDEITMQARTYTRARVVIDGET